jgi:negative regulator of flagellin synthesis FlgM
MKIGQNSGPNLYKTYEIQLKNKGQKSNAQGAASQSTGDVLDLSEEVKELQFYRIRMAKMPSVREDLVSMIKTSIEEQSYQADAERIIDGMANELFLDKQCKGE